MVLKKWKSIEKLDKGWSVDEKYIVTNDSNERFLLRLTDSSLYEKKKRQFEFLQRIGTLGINASKAIDFGVCEDGKVYTLLTWLEGESAEDVLPTLSDRDAYQHGIEAGITLKKMHSMPIAVQDKTWYERISLKASEQIEAFRACPLDIPNRERYIAEYSKRLELMKNRPLAFCHGDYHVGNLIVKDGKIGVIDFDRHSISDPYDDFRPFFWNVFLCPEFERGLLDGYFEGNIPSDFFDVLAFYALRTCISHLPWAMRFGEEEVKKGYRILQAMDEWFKGFSDPVPTWYRQ